MMRNFRIAAKRLSEIAFEQDFDQKICADLYDLSNILDIAHRRAESILADRFVIEIEVRYRNEWMNFCGEYFTEKDADDRLTKLSREYPTMNFRKTKVEYAA